METRFDDFAGGDEAKEELQEMVTFLKDPSVYRQLGGQMPKGGDAGGAAGNGQNPSGPGGGR